MIPKQIPSGVRLDFMCSVKVSGCPAVVILERIVRLDFVVAARTSKVAALPQTSPVSPDSTLEALALWPIASGLLWLEVLSFFPGEHGADRRANIVFNTH